MSKSGKQALRLSLTVNIVLITALIYALVSAAALRAVDPAELAASKKPLALAFESASGLSSGFRAIRCLACNPAPCAQACPTTAYSQRKGGGVVVKKKLCIRCGACIAACPVDAIYQNEKNEVYVCIHCGRCVEFCPQDCLDYEKTDDIEEVHV